MINNGSRFEISICGQCTFGAKPYRLLVMPSTTLARTRASTFATTLHKLWESQLSAKRDWTRVPVSVSSSELLGVDTESTVEKHRDRYRFVPGKSPHGQDRSFGIRSEATVYFVAHEQFTRSVLGRIGWLDRNRLGLIGYEAKNCSVLVSKHSLLSTAGESTSTASRNSQKSTTNVRSGESLCDGPW